MLHETACLVFVCGKTDNCCEKPLQFLVFVKLTARLDVGSLVTVVLGVSCLGSLQVICRDWLLDFGFVTLHMVAELLRNDAA